MDELDLYIAELIRVRRSIQVYIELFSSKEATDTLANFSSDIFGIIQRSMHDEIVISLSRLYDGKSFKYKGETKENLSQFNLVSKYENHLTEKLKSVRRETSLLFDSIDIKLYRDSKVAHTDKSTSLGEFGTISHNITSENVISLVEKSLDLIIGIKAERNKTNSVSVPVNLAEKFEGKGVEFVKKLSEI